MPVKGTQPTDMPGYHSPLCKALHSAYGRFSFDRQQPSRTNALPNDLSSAAAGFTYVRSIQEDETWPYRQQRDFQLGGRLQVLPANALGNDLMEKEK